MAITWMITRTYPRTNCNSFSPNDHSILDALVSSACHVFVDRPHQEPQLLWFQPLTVDEVHPNGYCLQCHRSHCCLMYCRVRCLSRALMSLHQSLPHLLTSCCRQESFLPATWRLKYNHCWRSLDWKVRCWRTTGQYRTCLQSPWFSRALCWLVCVITCWAEFALTADVCDLQIMQVVSGNNLCNLAIHK